MISRPAWHYIVLIVLVFEELTWKNVARFWREPYFTRYSPLSYTLYSCTSSRFLGHALAPCCSDYRRIPKRLFANDRLNRPWEAASRHLYARQTNFIRYR